MRSALGEHHGLAVTLYHSNPGQHAELMGRTGTPRDRGPFTHAETLQIDGTWIVQVHRSRAS